MMKKLFLSLFLWIGFAGLSFGQQSKVTNQVPLDQKIIYGNDEKTIDSLFKNMIVVQKKVFERKHKFIFLSNLSLDFSDNPKTMYSGSLGVGFALLENIELHLSVAPYFMSKDRDIVAAVRQLRLANGQYAELLSPTPKLMAEGSLLWAFAYGKDAFGPYSIIRSDTFVKLSLASISYQSGEKGIRSSVFLGKTFFISRFFNFRLEAGFARQTSYVNGKSQMSSIGLIQPGVVWFL